MAGHSPNRTFDPASELRAAQSSSTVHPLSGALLFASSVVRGQTASSSRAGPQAAQAPAVQGRLTVRKPPLPTPNSDRKAGVSRPPSAEGIGGAELVVMSGAGRSLWRRGMFADQPTPARRSASRSLNLLSQLSIRKGTVKLAGGPPGGAGMREHNAGGGGAAKGNFGGDRNERAAAIAARFPDLPRK